MAVLRRHAAAGSASPAPGATLYLRPHAQGVWSGVQADAHREENGTRVSQTGEGNVFSRVGGRLWLDGSVTF